MRNECRELSLSMITQIVANKRARTQILLLLQGWRGGEQYDKPGQLQSRNMKLRMAAQAKQKTCKQSFKIPPEQDTPTRANPDLLASELAGCLSAGFQPAGTPEPMQSGEPLT